MYLNYAGLAINTTSRQYESEKGRDSSDQSERSRVIKSFNGFSTQAVGSVLMGDNIFLEFYRHQPKT